MPHNDKYEVHGTNGTGTDYNATYASNELDGAIGQARDISSDYDLVAIRVKKNGRKTIIRLWVDGEKQV